MLEAEKLDPVSPITSYVATAAYLANDRIDEAISEGQRTLQLDPNYFYLDSDLAAAYREKGNFPEAIALYTKAQDATHLPSSGLAITYTRMGREMEARNILAQLMQAREKRYVSAPVIAAVYVAFGDKEEAFRWLERAFAEHSGILQWIAFLPEFRRAPFRRTFPSSFAANRCFAGLNFGDHRDNSVRDYRSERPDSPDPEDWSKATTRHAEWPRCQD